MKLTHLQQKALDIIRQHSKSYPITARYLAGELELKKQSLGMEQANIRQVINALRFKGFPVCAGKKGYYYARNWYELSNYMVQLENRKAKINEALTGLSKALTNIDYPETKKEMAGKMLVQHKLTI